MMSDMKKWADSRCTFQEREFLRLCEPTRCWLAWFKLEIDFWGALGAYTDRRQQAKEVSCICISEYTMLLIWSFYFDKYWLCGPNLTAGNWVSHCLLPQSSCIQFTCAVCSTLIWLAFPKPACMAASKLHELCKYCDIWRVTCQSIQQRRYKIHKQLLILPRPNALCLPCSLPKTHSRRYWDTIRENEETK